MKKILSILLFILWGGSSLKAQESKSDTTYIAQLIQQAEAVADSNTEKAISILEQARTLSKENHLPIWEAEVLYKQSYYQYYLTNYEKVIEICEEAATIYAKQKLPIKEAKCYNRIGLSLTNVNKFQPALQYFFKAIKLAETKNDQKTISALNNNIGLVYESLRDWDNALKYMQRSLQYKQQINDQVGIARVYDNIGNILQYKGKLKESKSYFHFTLTYYKKNNLAKNYALVAANLGNLLTDLNESDSAIYYHLQALAYLAPRKNNAFHEWCVSIAGLANAWFQKGNLNKTAFYLNQCKTCEENIKDFAFFESLYPLEAKYYKKIGNYKLAAEYLEKHSNIRDSLLAESSNFENQRIAINFEYQKKAQEDSLKNQLLISNQALKTTAYKNKTYLLLLFLLLLTIIAIVIVGRVKAIQKRKRRKELEQLRNNLAGDLHDEVGSTLSSIQIMSSLALQHCKDNEPLKDSVSRIAALSDKVSDGLREIVWAVNPMHDKLKASVVQLRKLATELLSTKNIPFTFIEQIEEPEKILYPQLRKDLFLIFKESLNNVRKYSGTHLVDISLEQKNNSLNLTIKDYGCGFNQNEITGGNGLANMKRRAAELNAVLNLNSQPGKGTILSLQIPLP